MEQDPMELLEMVRKCIDEAIKKLKNLSPNAYSGSDIVAVGITNQRETIVVWDKKTGRPLYNAIGELDLMHDFRYIIILVCLLFAFLAVSGI